MRVTLEEQNVSRTVNVEFHLESSALRGQNATNVKRVDESAVRCTGRYRHMQGQFLRRFEPRQF